VSLAAKLAEMPVDQFMALNPGFSRPLIRASVTPRIILPADKVDVFHENLQKLDDKSLVSWRTYNPKKGDTLESIAKKHGTTVSHLKQVNGISPRSRAMPTVMVVNPSKGYKSLQDLVAAAKAKPGELVAANAGMGSSTHMNLERFRLAAGVTFLNVPMKGPSEAMSEVIAGRADLYFAPVFSIIPHVKEGRLVPLAVGSPKRTALFPDLPTTVEAGYPNSDYNFWIGALVATRTPKEIVERLNKEFNAALRQPDIQERMKNLGVDNLTMSREEFEAMIRKELAENAELVKRAGIKTN